MISAGPREGFKGGWAIIPFRRLPHYWEPEQDILRAVREPELTPRGRIQLWRSLCGLWSKTSSHIQPLGAGDFPHCKRCAKKVPA